MPMVCGVGMKWLCLPKALLCIFLFILLPGCGGGGGGSSTGEGVNVAGAWDIVEEVDENSCGVLEGYQNVSSMTVSQSGNDLTLETPVGTFSGTVGDSDFSWTGHYPDDGGTKTITSTSLTLAEDGNSFNGSANWTWTDGTTNCSGTSRITGTRSPEGGDGRPPGGGGADGPGGDPGGGTRPGSGGDGPGSGGDDGVAPQKPTSLVATAESSTSIRLDWVDSSDNEDGFKVERSTSSSGPWVETGSVSVNMSSYTSIYLTPDTTYYYRVRAYNRTGHSGYSNVNSSQTLAHSTAPVLTVGSVNASGQFPFEWTYTFSMPFGSTNDGYEFQESETSATSGYVTIYSTVGEDDQESPKQGWVTPEGIGTRYYRVRANDDGAFTPWSNVVTITASGSQTLTLSPSVAYFIYDSNQDNDQSGTYFDDYGGVQAGCNWDVGGGLQTYVCAASVFKFDLTALTGRTVDSAILTLSTEFVGVGDYPRDGFIKAQATYWDETITWDTLMSNKSYVDTSHSLLYPTYSSQTYTINVVDTVRNWVDGTFNNNGWALFSEDYSYPLGAGFAVTSLDIYGFTQLTLTISYH